MKKLWIFMLSAVTVLVLAFPLTACKKGSHGALDSVAETYAYSAVSAVEMLPITAGAKNAYGYNAQGETQNGADVNRYVAISQSLLKNGAIQTQTTTDQEKTIYGGVTYANRMTVSVTDIDGQNRTYEFYFDEAKRNERGEVEYEREGRKRQVTVEERETHVRSEITGVIVFGENAYAVQGNKHVESERETGITPESEVETTLTLTVTASSGARATVVYEYAKETEGKRTEVEQTFDYTVKNHLGQVTSQGEIEVETEGAETEVEIRVSEGGNVRAFRLQKDGNRMRMAYTENGKALTASIRIVRENGIEKYEYTFSDGSIVVYE